MNKHKGSIPTLSQGDNILFNLMLTKTELFIITCFDSAQPAQTHANSKQTMPVLRTFFAKKKSLPFACTRHFQSE